jgi:hypothetical protein
LKPPKGAFNIVLKMSESVVDEVRQRFPNATMERSGVSFEGKSLKLDTEDDGNYGLFIG